MASTRALYDAFAEARIIIQVPEMSQQPRTRGTELYTQLIANKTNACRVHRAVCRRNRADAEARWLYQVKQSLGRMSGAIYTDTKSRLVMGTLLALPFLYLLVLHFRSSVVALSLRDYQPAYAIDDYIGLENYRENPDRFTELASCPTHLRLHLCLRERELHAWACIFLC